MYQCEPSAEADIDVLICWFGNVLIREASAEAETAGFELGWNVEIWLSFWVIYNELIMSELDNYFEFIEINCTFALRLQGFILQFELLAS